jgi:hypothetical protein
LPGVFASDIIFAGCELEGSIFSRSILTQSQFINCSLEKSSFIESSLHQTIFHNTDLDRTNFSGAVLTEMTFFDGIFQQVDLTNADLFRSNLTNSELNIFFNTSKANIFANTRFPNGSFSYIDSQQLVKDGGGELEVRKRISVINLSIWFSSSVLKTALHIGLIILIRQDGYVWRKNLKVVFHICLNQSRANVIFSLTLPVDIINI